jgi:hypothetical protein
MIWFRADQNGRVERVNDNKQVCKKACCCRGVIYNNERGAGGCGVESLMEMSGGWAAREEGTEETYFYLFFDEIRGKKKKKFGSFVFKCEKFKSVKWTKSF